jgi:hypothetical protein
MPATYEIDLARRLVVSRGWGVLEDADLATAQAALRADPRFDAHFRQIFDVTAVTEVRVTGEALISLSRASAFAVDARRAVVVSGDLAFGMARMYGLASDRGESFFQIFRDEESALRWLDEDPAGAP